MKRNIISLIKLCLVMIAFGALTIDPKSVWAAIEVQSDIIALERSPVGLDKAQVNQAVDGFAATHEFKSITSESSFLYQIERRYLGPRYTTMVLQLGTRHVFISIAKRPNDIEEYAELIADAQQAFRPLGFSPWIEATNGPDTK